MPPFPIVTGAPVSSTSLPLPTPADVIRNVVASEERYEDSHRHGSMTATAGVRRRVIGTPLVTVGTDASSTLSATMTISYVETVVSAGSNDDEVQQQQQQGSSNMNGHDGAANYQSAGQQQQHHSGSSNSSSAAVADGLTAEVRVSIAPTASSLSKSTRETACRVQLLPYHAQDTKGQHGGTRHGTGGGNEELRYGLTDVCPSVVFSSDGGYLACLVPCPVPLVAERGNSDDASPASSSSGGTSGSGGEAGSGIHRPYYKATSDKKSPPLSSLIIFTLKRPSRRPTTAAAAAAFPDLPPPPGFDGQQPQEEEEEYQQKHHSQKDSIVVPVASSPRSLSAHSVGKGDGRGPRADRITSICPASSSSSLSSHPNAHASTSVLLAGTADGSILAVGYRRAKVAGVLYRPARKRPSPNLSSTSSDGSHEAQQGQHNDQFPTGPEALISMDHVEPASSTAANAGVGVGAVGGSSMPSEAGRLAVVRADGSVAVYRTLFVPAGVPGRADGDTSKALPSHLSPPEIERNDSDRSFRGAADLGDTGSCDGVSAHIPFRKDSESSLDSVRKNIRFTPPALAGALGSVKATGIGSGMTDRSPPERLPRPARSSSAGSAAWGGLMMKVERLAAMRQEDDIPPFVRAVWFSIDYVVLLARPYQPGTEDMTPRHASAAFRRTPRVSKSRGRNNIVAQIWRVKDDTTPALIATLRIGKDELFESSHGTFQLRHAPSKNFVPHALSNANGAVHAMGNDLIPLASFGSSLGVSCHYKRSDCIALSGTLLVLAKPPDSTPSHVESRFAQGNGEADFAGTSTPSDSARTIQREILMRPFVCIWDWRNSVLGVTLRSASDEAIPQQLVPRDVIVSSRASSALCSRLLFCRPSTRVVHVRAGSGCVQKDVFGFGLLSPSSVEERVQGSVEEASPLMASADSIAFPIAVNPTTNQDSTVLWREAQIPATYLSANGPAHIATLGRRLGRSVAVSSSRGLCILDLSLMVAKNSANFTADETETSSNFATSTYNPCVRGHICSSSPDAVPLGMRNVSMKWRMFRNESEEQSFRVLAMTWWERSAEKSSSEDLLIAAIEYISEGTETSDSQPKQYYLVCWSRRKLGLGQYQLLGEADASLDSGKKDGIALPKGLEPSSLSILAEPTGHRKGSIPHIRHRTAVEATRAVLLISSSRQGPVTYMVYQLQATDSTPISVIDSSDNQKTNQVLSKLCSTGRIPPMPGYKERGPLSPFLAGASFQFDLTESTTGFNTHAYVATIGLIKEMGGAAAICVTPFGPSFGGFVLPGSGNDDVVHSDITNYWLSDIIQGESVAHGPCNAFVWTITRNDGKSFSWRVPFFLRGEPVAAANTEATLLRPMDSDRNSHWHNVDESHLEPPTTVSASEFFLPSGMDFLPSDTGISRRYSFLGEACYVGDSAFINSNATNDNDLAIGPLPPLSSGCILYLGQQSRTLQPRLPDSTGAFSPNPSYRTADSRTLQFNVFGTSECIVGPATIATSLFFAYLDVASLPASSSRQSSRRHIESILCKRGGDDVIFSALRIVVLRTVAVLSSLKRRPEYKDETSFSFAQALLIQVVSTTRYHLHPLKFCSLFLGLGRQIEPHDFNALFPLPCSLTSASSGSNIINDASNGSDPSTLTFYTVEDLFLESIRHRSVAVASASLPLFSSKAKSLKWCKQLLWLCLCEMEECIDTRTPPEHDRSAEEKVFIRQLYKFGLKLEGVADEASIVDDSSDSDEVAKALGASFDAGLYDSISYEYSDDEIVSTPCRIRGYGRVNPDGKSSSRISRLMSTITPTLWNAEPSKERVDEEKAISEAASMFIFSVFDKTDRILGEGPEAGYPEISTSIDESVLTAGEEVDEPNTGDARSIPLSLPSLQNRSITGIICEHIAAAFQEALEVDDRMFTCWTQIASIAMLISDGTAASSLAIANAQEFLRSISEDELASNAATAAGPMEINDSIATPPALVNHIHMVSYRLDDHVAGVIFDVATTLLLDHDRHADVRQHAVPLILVSIVAGHITGHAEDLIGTFEDSALANWYHTNVAMGLSCA